jgi:RNase P/RNase MRP subunit POP5
VTQDKEKVRKRYLVVRLDCEEEIPRNVLIKAIRKAAAGFGDNYYEEVGPWLTYFERNYGVIKYNHKKKEQMLALVERMSVVNKDSARVPIHTLGISGTINKARKKYIP